LKEALARNLEAPVTETSLSQLECKLASRSDANLRFKKACDFLKEKFGGALWGSLSEDSRKSFILAQALYSFCQDLDGDCDHGPAFLKFGNAIMYELNARLWKPLYDNSNIITRSEVRKFKNARNRPIEKMDWDNCVDVLKRIMESDNKDMLRVILANRVNFQALVDMTSTFFRQYKHIRNRYSHLEPIDREKAVQLYNEFVANDRMFKNVIKVLHCVR
jgi:hypothetical protein